MNTLEGLLAGIVSDPVEETRWLVVADWLEENDDPRRSELLRLHRKLLATCCEPEHHPERTQWHARIAELIAEGVQPCIPQETLLLPGDVPMTFSFIPPGCFRMGSNHKNAQEDQKPVHKVTITQGFFLGIHQVTQAQWKTVMGTDPSHVKGPNRPVETVSWGDAQEFCLRVSSLILGPSSFGKTFPRLAPFSSEETEASLQGFSRGTSGRKTKDETSVTVRLPTEAEWEYACRAGTTTEYHFGDVINAELANYNGNYSWNGSPKGQYRKQTTDVGSFPSNAWGLFDVYGNVWEWCEDWYGPYPAEDQIDPCRTELHSDNSRVLRGGSWFNLPVGCRTAFRNWDAPAYRLNYFGLRVCFRLD
jgi:uncharacterized protein (TIGR02996 family)